jgi:hypothetical protein
MARNNLPLLNSATASTLNITSALSLVATYTAAARTMVQARVALSSLNAAAANITLYAEILSAGAAHVMYLPPGGGSAITKLNTSDTAYGDQISFIGLESGELLKIFAKSSNASDTAAAATVLLYDQTAANVYDFNSGGATFSGATPKSDASAINGDTGAAANLAAAANQMQAGTFDVRDATGNVVGNVDGNVGGDVQGEVLGTLGDPRIINLDAAVSSRATQTSVNNINNLSALASLIGPGVMEIPASSSIAYRFTLLVKTVEGLLEDLTTTPTVAAINTAGTDRSANLSIITHTGTGVYDFNYTMQSTAAQEGLRIQATGTAVSDSTSRVAVLISSAVSVDQGAAIAAIKAKTDTIGTNAGDSPNAAAAQGNAATAATQATGANANTADVPGMLQSDGAGKKQFTVKAVENAPSGGGGSGLTGASGVTLNFVDAGSVAVPNVDFTIVGKGSATTDVNGVKAFGLDNSTYTVRARPVNGTLFADAALVVSGTTALTVTGTAAVIPGAVDPSTTNAYLYTYDGSGVIEPGVSITFRLVSSPAGDGYSFDGAPFILTSDTNGRILQALPKSTGYVAQRGAGTKTAFTTGTGGTYAIPEIIGKDAN